jgi:hypothetical protein
VLLVVGAGIEARSTVLSKMPLHMASESSKKKAVLLNLGADSVTTKIVAIQTYTYCKSLAAILQSRRTWSLLIFCSTEGLCSQALIAYIKRRVFIEHPTLKNDASARTIS